MTEGEKAAAVAWARANLTIGGGPGHAKPAGRMRIRDHFGCSGRQSERLAAAAKAGWKEAHGAGTSSPAVLQPRRKFDPEDPAYRSGVIHKLRHDSMSIPELAEYLGRSEQDAELMIESLRQAGYNVGESGGRFTIGKLLARSVPRVLTFDRLDQKPRIFGAVSDTHLCSVHQRLDVLEVAYEQFAREKVEFVLHCGNLIDGYSARINGDEVIARGVTDQAIYTADHYPQRKGITTYFITGECHEGWYMRDVGLNVGHHIEDELHRHGREDLRYAGHVEVDIELKTPGGSCILRYFHAGGGVAYAMSYQPQKIVESYQGGEKPAILLIGHYHKAGYFTPREVHTVLVPSCQDQPVFMRTRHIASHVGYVILRVTQDKQGAVSGFVAEFRPFFDRGYHVDAGEIWMPSLLQMLT